MVWYQLRWPREVSAQQLQEAFRLLATAGGLPLVIETRGTTDSVAHYLSVPRGRSGSVAAGLRAIMPGISLEALEHPSIQLNRSVNLRLSTKRRELRTDEPDGVSRALLSALSHLGEDEELVLQWVLSRGRVPVSVPNRMSGVGTESILSELAAAPFGTRPLDTEVRNALRSKQAQAGWRGVGRLGVRAASATRERQLIRQVLGALRTADAPGVGFRVRSGSPRQLAAARSSLLAPLRLNSLELAAIAGWPVGPTADLPVSRLSSRPLPPSRAIPSRGRILGLATFPGRERPVALGIRDATRHLHVLGPSGSGKSTLLGRLIVADIEAGRGVVVLEPKGDLIGDVLARIPQDRINDVVVLDPTDTERPVGLNPLAPAGRNPELVADQLLGVLHGLYAANWGPRTSDILGNALLTLARKPGMTLAALVLLLTDAGFRRRIVGEIDDPIALGPFWSSFEAWSEGERAAAIAPSLNKLRPFLRPELRAVLGQATPRFDLRQVFWEKKIVLVNLAKGQLGPEATALLGNLVIAQLWQAIQGRSAVPPEKRHPVAVYIDEFQDYVKGLPLDFADALAQSRGLGICLTLAHQYLHQLDAAMRSAVLSNAQSRVAFRLPHEDAVTLAAGSQLAPEDMEGLGAYEAYAQLVAGDSVQRWFSVKTEPLPEPTSDPEAIKAASREAFGVDRTEVEAALLALVRGDRRPAGDDVGRRRRPGGQS
jgi:hypothetical protein